MTDAERYEDWVRRYISAWSSNDPSEIGDLFTTDAHYRPVPFADGWDGRDEIVKQWLDGKDEPGDWSFDHEVAVATPEMGIVRGRTIYRSRDEEYYNLWEVTLDLDDRCSRFVEWWMQPPR